MPTPVGPAPRDPDDPDLWDEWYEDADDERPPPRHRPMWIRVVAALVLLGVVILLVFR